MTTRKTAATRAAANEPWVHCFERADLGKAPFKVIGYSKEVYQAVPGDPNCPVQPGSCCDYCNNGIMHVYRIMGADGRVFKVGCDCVARTGDTALDAEARRERRAWEREQARIEWERVGKAERDERRRREAAERQARAERNASALVWILDGAMVVADSPNASMYERGVIAAMYRELTEGQRSGITAREWRSLSIAYLAALLPVSRHVGVAGERLRGVVARYEGGPTIGIDSLYGPKVLAKFRVMEGPMAGAILMWKTAYHPARIGAVVTLTGTVDKGQPHSEYEGVAQTRVSRCKVDVVDESACGETDSEGRPVWPNERAGGRPSYSIW
jgi:hypothetical protein